MEIQKTILPWIDQSQKIKPTAIVLHWWQTPSWLVGIRWFRFAMWRKRISVQFAITKNGKIYQFTDTPDVRCHHARCANDSSIGIELQGLGARELDRQPDQFKATVDLVAQLCNQFRIKPDFDVERSNALRFYGITSHKTVDAYCSGIRLLKKRDVHNDYVKRVIDAVSSKLKF